MEFLLGFFFHIVFLGFLNIPYLYNRLLFFEVLIEKRQLAAWIVVVFCCVASA